MIYKFFCKSRYPFLTSISEFTIIQTLNFFLITKSMQENPIGYRVDRGIDPSIRK